MNMNTSTLEALKAARYALLDPHNPIALVLALGRIDGQLIRAGVDLSTLPVPVLGTKEVA